MENNRCRLTGACLLGSINLSRLVTTPFEAGAEIDSATLADLVATAVRMMDNVVDTSKFPLEAQAQEARKQTAHWAGRDRAGGCVVDGRSALWL